MKVFKDFIKPFEVPQRGVKIKIQVNFYFNTTFWPVKGGKGWASSNIKYKRSKLTYV